MPQFRLTLKFSKDLAVKSLPEPEASCSFFDDWFIDVVRVDRKKVAFAMHAKTYFSLLIPYTHVGGAKGVPSAIKDLLIKFVVENNLPEYQEKIHFLFREKFTYCKTKDRSVLGHMRDFKNFIDSYTMHTPFAVIDWNEVIVKVNTILAGDSKGDYNRPVDLMLRSLTNGC